MGRLPRSNAVNNQIADRFPVRLTEFLADALVADYLHHMLVKGNVNQDAGGAGGLSNLATVKGFTGTAFNFLPHLFP